MSRELLEKACEFLGNPTLCGEDGADLYEKIQAELKKPDPEPDYWHVVDEDGNSIYSASFKEACHDHIKEAQLSDDIYFAVDVASKWVVKPLWSNPPVQPEPLSEDEIIKLWVGSDTVRPVLGKNKILRFARTIEQKVRGEK